MSIYAQKGKPKSASIHNRRVSHIYNKQDEYDSPTR